MIIQTQDKRQQVIDEAARLGVAIMKSGAIYHLFGQGVDIKVADLAYLTLAELSPPRWTGAGIR